MKFADGYLYTQPSHVNTRY